MLAMRVISVLAAATLTLMAGPGSPWAFLCITQLNAPSCSGGFQRLNHAEQAMEKLARRKQGPFLTGTRSVTACHIPLPTTVMTGHSKEEKGGVDRANRLQTLRRGWSFFPLTTWRVNSLSGSQDWIICSGNPRQP